jgi:hypothetical protein
MATVVEHVQQALQSAPRAFCERTGRRDSCAAPVLSASSTAGSCLTRSVAVVVLPRRGAAGNTLARGNWVPSWPNAATVADRLRGSLLASSHRPARHPGASAACFPADIFLSQTPTCASDPKQKFRR